MESQRLAVDLETTLATDIVEWEVVKARVKRLVKRGSTLGADKNHDVAEFVWCRETCHRTSDRFY